MKSLKQLGTRSASLPLLADEVIEFHAARLLLLFKLCGTAGRIDGLTKMAKLDFFARYPDFFEIARAKVAPPDQPAPNPGTTGALESAMVRHYYGPWDKRYYQILGMLEATGLITIKKEGSAFRISLTQAGGELAGTLAAKPSFALVVARMREIKTVFGSRTGNSLKTLIYELFDDEISRRPIGETIE
jgi:hypothetical protein